MVREHILHPEIFRKSEKLRCAMSTRHGGVSPEPFGMNLSYATGDVPSNVEKNRSRFFESLGISEDRLAVPKQCHSATVRRIERPGQYDSTDGLMTDRTDLWLIVSVADCVPVFLFDRKKRVVAAIHAGWRGSSLGIAGLGVQSLVKEFRSDPSDIETFVGPSAGPCCYEVGEDVASKFRNGVIVWKGEKPFLDLKKENMRQLTVHGIPERNIEVSPSCTICNSDLFHSYRRDRERSGRMLGVIGLIGD